MLLDYQHSVFSTGVTDHWNEVDWTGLDSNTSDISYKLSETKFKHTQKSTQWNINFQGAVNFESYLLHIANSSLATMAMRGLNHLVSKPRPAFCHLQYLCTESLRRRLLLSVFYNFSFQVLCTRLIICILWIVNCVYTTNNPSYWGFHWMKVLECGQVLNPEEEHTSKNVIL